VFRIDHFLGKEAVQNLLFFRFENAFMEPPAGSGGEPIRDELAKVLRSIRPLAPSDVVRGQYAGYRQEAGVAADSEVKTFAAMRVHLDSWRWSGVPFFIRAGKRLPVAATEVVVNLRRPPQQTFPERTPPPCPTNSTAGVQPSRRKSSRGWAAGAIPGPIRLTEFLPCQEATMHRISTRRRFVTIAPAIGVILIAACSKTPEPALAPAPAAAPPVTPPPAAAPSPAEQPAPASSAPAPAASTAMVDEKDPQAQALGYLADATLVDTAKHKAFVAGSQCAACAQYQGKPGETTGPCTIFQGKQVAAKGWCSAFVRKA